MKTSDLSVINEGISVRGVAFRRNAIHFDSRLNLDQLNLVANAVSEVNGGTAWWLGDVGLEIQARNREANDKLAAQHDYKIVELTKELDAAKGDDRSHISKAIEDHATKAKKLREDACDEYRATRAQVMGIDAGYWANCVGLSRFFPPSQRCEALTPDHHRAAMKAGGGASNAGNPVGMAVAQQWLKLAVANKWTASQMRSNIADDGATASKPSTDPEKDSFKPLWEADQWATSHRDSITNIDAHQAAKMLVSLQSLAAIIDALRERAKQAA